MSLQHLGKGTLRVVKNYTKGYSDVQAKVRDATSNDPWGPSGTQMNELAQMTYNQNDFVEIMEMLDKRLNDKGKNWRHVFKALTVLDYCLHAGSENVVIYFKDNIYVVKTLKEFQYVDEYGKDQGANVRQKAKDITNLLQDESRLREERRSRAHMRDRMIGQSPEEGYGDGDEDPTRRARSAPPGGRGRGRGGEDDELKRAIEASKQSLQDEQARTAEENDLQKALKLSQEEEEKRKRALEDENARSLFDDTQQLAPASTNPFPLVDPTGNASGLQPQFAQLQPQFTQVQPQFTSFNPYAQMQQEAMQAEYLRNQQQWMQQQQQAQAQAQQEEWMRQQQLQQFQLQQQQQQQQLQMQQMQQPQQLAPQPTGFGSKNPFAPGSFSPAPSVSPNSNFQPSASAPPASFSAPSLTVPQSSSPAPQQPQQPARKRDDGEHAHLANLFANRPDDGQDTFGNIGVLRYGHTQAGLQAQKTGHNPFHQQQQQPSAGDQPFFSI